MKKKLYWAKVQARILRLEGEKSHEFALEEAPTELVSLRPRLDKDTQALKKAKETKHLDGYTSQSQKHLDKYFSQVKLTFQLKPTIYASKEDKCMYTSEYFGETPADD